MNLKILIIIMAIFSLVWGVGFILIPGLFGALYGFALDDGGIYMTRQLGVVFLMLGIILWLARQDTGSKSLRAIHIGLLIGNTLGAVVALVGQFTAPVSSLGWVGVVSYFVLALGFGYCLLK
ncbi:MAG: hypothetical protein K0B06_07470 [Brevefilum sp.]|nr:hypothetical protein [Brevefilum sp.]